MNIDLTEEQRREARACGDAPLRLTDPETKRQYVLLPAEVYDRLRALFDDGPDMRQVGALVEQNMREEDAGDPLLDGYQRYRNPS
jgi:hypothetical protein